MSLLPRYRGPLTVSERLGERGFSGIAPHWCLNCGSVWAEMDRTRCPHCGCGLGDGPEHDYSFLALRRYHISRRALAA